MSDEYSGSYQRFGVICEQNVMIMARDGTQLATDIYFPSIGEEVARGRFPVILERTPYQKNSPVNVTNGKYFARRGYICAIQDVRGRFDSEGEWYAFAKEAPDGYDTVQWLGTQKWSDGSVGTMGGSYAGSDQCALATLNPSCLSTMIVAVGASNYYHSSMRQNGALEQRFHMYIFRMAATSKEAAADPSLRAELEKVYTDELPQIVNQFPIREGGTILSRLPSYERWAIDISTHGEYGEYWKQRGYAISEYYEEHADVPTMYLGGWYDSYARNTCESYIKLSNLKESPQVLLMGPWTHGKYDLTFSGDVDFGIESHINYNDLRLAWFDHYIKGLYTEFAEWSPVRVFTMGTGDGSYSVLGSPAERKDYPGFINHGGYWRSSSEWPLPSTKFTPYYIHADGSLTRRRPSFGTSPSSTQYVFNPCDPVPTIGGGISAAETIIRAGAYDQRGRSDFFGCKDELPLSLRDDVLIFETPVLEKSLEVTGPIELHLWATSSAVDTDFTAKLVDVYPNSDLHPAGLAINITDSIIRARYRNGWENPEMMIPGEVYKFVFQLYPTSNVFKKGHRLRLDISSSNWPRFDVNPNTGGALGLERSYQNATQTIFHDRERPSNVILPLQDL